MAIRLVFDQVGLTDVLHAFRVVLDGGQAEITAEMETAVIRMKQHGRIVSTSIRVELGETSALSAHDHETIWTVERESLESAIESLEKCQLRGYVSPPEFMRVQVPKNKRLDYVYCELEGHLES
jgi:hypothetical protein